MTQKSFSLAIPTTGGGGGTGVQSIVAGMNITVDNTDPQNPIVSSTADDITVVANYSALPAASTVTGEFYWCSASQGTAWLPGSLGGTYYSAGLYYSNGNTWEYLDVPYQATQAGVDAGVITDQFITPFTFQNSSQLAGKISLNGTSSATTGYISIGNTYGLTATSSVYNSRSIVSTFDFFKSDSGYFGDRPIRLSAKSSSYTSIFSLDDNSLIYNANDLSGSLNSYTSIDRFGFYTQATGGGSTTYLRLSSDALQLRANVTGGSRKASIRTSNYTGTGTWDYELPNYGGTFAMTSDILATVLTGFSVPASSAVVATDTILAAFGKIQAQTNANVATLATKATINGDAPAGTYRLGTTNAQSFALRTNNADRLTVDASGNIVQAGTTTNFDIVVFRIRNLAGSFWRVFTNTITGQLDFGGDFTEVNFTKPITNLKGTNSRFVESDSAGNPTAIENIISHFIYNLTAQGLLSDVSNWNAVTGVYTGTTLASYLLEQGQYFEDAEYFYYMNSTTVPLRIAKSNTINKTKAVFVTAAASVSSYTERFFFVNGSFNFTLPDPTTYTDVELTFKNISASDTCTLTGYNVDLTTGYAIAPLGFVKIKSSGAGWYKIS